MMRIGTGYDVHQLQEGLPLWIGGERIEHTHGLLGHSDADVLLHAICDALLGAAALGDIGKHFPDTDPQYKGISSLRLLAHVGELLKEHGYASATSTAHVVAQRPRWHPTFRRCARTSPTPWASTSTRCRSKQPPPSTWVSKDAKKASAPKPWH